MKLTQTGLPRRFVRSIVPPPTWGTTRAGAGSPTWNRPDAEPDGPAEGAPGPDAVGDGALEGDGDRIGIETDGTGAGVAAAPGSGAKARIPPSTSNATATPARRPARIDRRGDMIARRVPVRTGTSVTGVLRLRFRSDGRPFRLSPHATAARRADGRWRHAPGGRPADLHRPGHGGTGCDAVAATERL